MCTNMNFKLWSISGIEDQSTPFTAYYQNNQKVVAVICSSSEWRQPSIITSHLELLNMAGKYTVHGTLQAFALTSATFGNLSQQACDYDSIVLQLHVYCLYKNIEQQRILIN